MNKREELYSLLRDLPDRDQKISGRLVAAENFPAFTLERWVLDLNGNESVPALYIAPTKRGSEKLPLVVYNHGHGNDYTIGKEELIDGRRGLSSPYVSPLAELGFAVLAIDAWCFCERRGRTESAVFKEMLWRGRSMWGMMVYDTLKALDWVLAEKSEIDASRVASMGISMGSTMSWWCAALDERISLCLDTCCLSEFDSLIEHEAHDLHGVYYFVPGLLKKFGTVDINALIAPRRHVSLAGIADPLTPPEGLDKVDAGLKKIYAEMGADGEWKLHRFSCGHFESHEMRAVILDELTKFKETTKI